MDSWISTLLTVLLLVVAGFVKMQGKKIKQQEEAQHLESNERKFPVSVDWDETIIDEEQTPEVVNVVQSTIQIEDPIEIEDISSKGKIKIDANKLIIYSEIMKPKFQEM